MEEKKSKKEDFIIYKVKNGHKYGMLLENAATRMTKYGKRYWGEMYRVLRELANTGKPAEFQFNHLRIKYLTKDKYGNFKPHWIVADGISGQVKEFYTKDYVSDAGYILWKKMSIDMRKV